MHIQSNLTHNNQMPVDMDKNEVSENQSLRIWVDANSIIGRCQYFLYRFHNSLNLIFINLSLPMCYKSIPKHILTKIIILLTIAQRFITFNGNDDND
jgi:hypothetical protein